MAYTKEFLIQTFLSRYVSLESNQFLALERLTLAWAKGVDTATLRTYCSLDAEAIRQARQTSFMN